MAEKDTRGVPPKVPAFLHEGAGGALSIAEPVTTANARIGPAILVGAIPFELALSFEKAAWARVRAWLTSDVGRNHQAPGALVI